MAPDAQTPRFRGVLHWIANCFCHRLSALSSNSQPNRPVPSTSQTTTANGESGRRVSFKMTDRTKVECSICVEVKAAADISRPCRKCKEPWCHNCLRFLFTSATRDLGLMPARCHNRVMHHNVAKGILSEEELANYKLKYEEFCTPKPFYCPIPTCSTFLPPRKVKAPKHSSEIDCPACATKICAKCRQIAHDGRPCTPDIIVSKIKSLKYKLCPKCGTGVLKMYGCDHIRCHCGAHWCWACERSIDICWSNPCPAQMNDGDPEADIEEDEEEEEDLGIAMTMTDSTTELAEIDYTAFIPQPHEIAQQIVIPVTRPATPTPVPAVFSPPPALVPETMTSDDSQTTMQTVPDITIQTAPEEPQNITAIAPEADNPDDPAAHDWEYYDIDFGDEPADESWDVWGCAHKSKRFEEEDMHEGWLQKKDLECQTCFCLVHPHAGNVAGGDQDSRAIKRTRSGRAIVNEGLNLAAPVETADNSQPEAAGNISRKDQGEVGKTARSDQKRAGKMAWECSKCGVLFCGRCRSENRAKRKLMLPVLAV